MRNWLGIAVLILGLASGIPSSVAEDLLDFEDIKGKWTGFGWFTYTAGNRERARCTAVIQPDGAPDKGSLEFHCTAGALDIKARAFNIVLNGAKARGVWAVPTFSAKGTLDGTISSTKLSVYLQPDGGVNAGYGARLSAELQNDCRVQLTQVIDSPLDLKKLDLNLRRC